jgi:predicted dinucleotide-binding enzyme
MRVLSRFSSRPTCANRSITFAQAAAHGELLVLAVLGNAAEEAIADAGADNFSGKVVIDAMNPLGFSGGFPPKLSITGEDSLGERVQRALPDANVVKAFNTIGNPYFVNPKFSEGDPTMLIAGDDERAERTVGDVLAAFGWSDTWTSAVSKARASSRRSASRGSRSAAHGARGTTGSSCSSASELRDRPIRRKSAAASRCPSRRKAAAAAPVPNGDDGEVRLTPARRLSSFQRDILQSRLGRPKGFR